jgi:hypothetical protein
MNQVDDTKNIFWAFDIDGDEVHISDVESGKKGYTCTQCGKVLVAHKGEIKLHHFKHHATGVKKNSCPYRNETVRHKIAKDILQIIKQVKVPALYKYPDDDSEGFARLIHPSKIISASSILIEREIYHDDLGEVVWRRSSEEANDKHFLVKADILFLDENNKPILIIELCATHKVDEEKKAKLNLLGINSIEINIPRGNEQDIEAGFKSVQNTKWLYHQDYEKTNYDSLPQSHSRRDNILDEHQRAYFEEGFKCRKSRLKNAIRAIEELKESMEFRKREEFFRTEIERMERNEERERDSLIDNQNKWEGIRSGIEERVKEEYSERIEGIQYDIYSERKKYKDLEDRYLRKRAEIEDAIKSREKEIERGAEIRYRESIRGRIERQINEELREPTKEAEGQIFEIDENYRRATAERQKYKLEENSIDRQTEEIDGQRKTVGDYEASHREPFEKCERENRDIEKGIEQAVNEQSSIRKSRGSIPAKFKRLEEELRDKHKGKVNSIEARYGTSNTEFEHSKRVEELAEYRRLSNFIEEVRSETKPLEELAEKVQEYNKIFSDKSRKFQKEYESDRIGGFIEECARVLQSGI